MRVLFCQPTLDRTGSEKSLLEVIGGLREETGFEIDLLAGRQGPMTREFTPLVDNLWIVAAPKLHRRWSVLWPYLRSYWKVFAAIRRIKKEQKPSLVYVNTLTFLPALVGASLNRLPCIVHIHEVETTYPKLYYRLCIALAALLARRIICVCDYICRQSGLPFSKRLRDKSTVIPNSSSYPAEPIRRSIEGAARILSVVPVTKKKGAGDLIRFAHELSRAGRPFELNIVGQITDNELYRMLTAKLEGEGLASSVRFASEVEDPEPSYRSAHILVHPSHSEGHPRVLVEAANFSLPAVTTDAGGAPEAVSDGETGFVVSVGDYTAMAERVLQLIEDKDLYDHFSANAYQKYQNQFTRSQLVARVRGLIEGLEM